MKEVVLNLFNVNSGNTSYTFDQVIIEDPRPSPPGSPSNTICTIRTQPRTSAGFFEYTFGYNRIDLKKVQTAHPSLTIPVQISRLSDALRIIRTTWNLNLNPEDFADVELPPANGSISIVARPESFGIIGGGIFTINRS
jgi:hypothetical protein